MRKGLLIAGLPLGLLALAFVVRAFFDHKPTSRFNGASRAPAACGRDLSRGAIIMLSGAPFDAMNPRQVRDAMDAYLDGVNASEFVHRCSGGKGLAVGLVKGQRKHLHQASWPAMCDALVAAGSSPIIIAGHSNGGASAVSLSRCLEAKGKTVDLLVTIDTVPTGRGLGDAFVVPANVKLSINTYVITNAVTWTIPFLFGHADKRADGKATINIGLEYRLPGFVAHRNAFLDFASGPLLDLTLASLEGAGEREMTRLALEKSRALAKESGIKGVFEGAGSKTEF